MDKAQATELLQALLNFAQNPTHYRHKRCGRFIDGIEWSLKTIETEKLDYAKDKDYDYWKQGKALRELKQLMKGSKKKK